MTPEQLTEILTGFQTGLGDIVSFCLGAVSGIAFVISASMRWD